jgi:hypothetical protein
MVLATLTSINDLQDINELPCEFTYTPYVAKKRICVQPTSKGSFVQRSKPLFNHGNQDFSWSIQLTTSTVAKMFYDMYVSGDLFVFTGFWGEEFLVEFIEFEKTPQGGFFSLRGKFKVLCVTSEFDPDCAPV